MRITEAKKFDTIIALDILGLVLMYLIPTISHLTALPLYKFEPMRCILLLTILFTGDRRNAYILAMTLPLFSYVFGGHPVLVKSLIMIMELLINVFLFFRLFKKTNNITVSVFISILISKFLYYIVKYVCINIGLLSTPLFATNIISQIVVIGIIVLVYNRYKDKYCVS